MRIPIAKPWFEQSSLAAVQRPLSRGWVAQGPEVAQFEQSFAARIGAPDAVACSSGTTALHLALVALGVGPGDEVVVPSFTWVATANAVEHCGARPVFCDIDPASFNTTAEQIAEHVGPATRAVIPVHLFGLPAPLAAIRQLAAQRSLSLLEDAACALGSSIGATHVGSGPDLATFSFHPRKVITTGEGGMVTCHEPKTAALLRSLRNHGAGEIPRTSDETDPEHPIGPFEHAGFNYRMTDIQAALGSAQLARLDEILRRRATRARRYDALLEPLSWLTRPAVPAGLTHAYQAYVCLFAPERPTPVRLATLSSRRDALMAALERTGVSTRQGTHAVHTLSYYRNKYGVLAESLPKALLADRLSIALPIYPQMTDEEQDYVVEQLGRAFQQA